MDTDRLPRCLIVEDDRILGETLSDAMADAGFETEWIADGLAARDRLAAGPEPALVILDLGLPGLDGTALLAWLRTHGSELPVLVLTARDSVENRIEGLNLGADDYLVKPFDLAELLARVRALQRRIAPVTVERDRWGDIEVACDASQAWLGGEPLELTGVELRMLHAFVTHRGATLSQSHLEQHIYDDMPEHSSNPFAVHLSRLRRKLGEGRIVNERGLGWRLA